MMGRLFVFLFLTLLVSAFASEHPLRCPADRATVRSDVAPSRIAFGSCNKQQKLQPLWKHIAERSPDIFTWLGDIVYADTPVLLKLRIPANATGVRQAYAEQCAAHPAYRSFLQRVPVTGVWDDHDYGVNDGDESLESSGKREARASLLEFLSEGEGQEGHGTPETETGVLLTNRHALPNGGAWTSMLLGAGAGRGRGRVHVILLDNRSNRSPYADVGPFKWWEHPACSKIAQGKVAKQIRKWWQAQGEGQEGGGWWETLRSTLRLLTVLPSSAIGAGGAHNTQGCAGVDYNALVEGQSPSVPPVGPPGSGPCRQDMLGPDQWAWLQQQLLEVSPLSDVILLGSGIQVLASGDIAISETWGRLPQSKARLLSLLSLYARGLLPGQAQAQAQAAQDRVRDAGGSSVGASPAPIFLLSGDVHFAELNAVYHPALGYPLYELTSSGLTHAMGQAPSTRAHAGPAGWLAHASTALAGLGRGGQSGRSEYAGPLAGPQFASPWTADWLQQAVVQLCTLGHTRVGGWYPGRNWGEVDLTWSRGGQTEGQAQDAHVNAQGEQSAAAEGGETSANATSRGGGGPILGLASVTLRALGVRHAPSTSPAAGGAVGKGGSKAGRRTWAEFAYLVAQSFGKSAWRWFGVDSRINTKRVIAKAKAKERERQREKEREQGADAGVQPANTEDWEGAEILEPITVIEHSLSLSYLSPSAWADTTEQDREAYPAPLARHWPAPQPADSDAVQKALQHARNCLSDPLDKGLTPSCAHVLQNTWPLPAHVDYMRYHAGHAVLYTILGAAAALAVLAPLWVLFLPYPKAYIVLILQLSARETRALGQPYWPGVGTARACVARLPGCRRRQKVDVEIAEPAAGTDGLAAVPASVQASAPVGSAQPGGGGGGRQRYVTLASLVWPYIALSLRPWAWQWTQPPIMGRALTCALLAVVLAGLRAYVTGLS